MTGVVGETLTPDMVADAMKVTPRTVRRWIVAGDLPAIDCGSFYRIEKDKFEAWKKARETRGGGK